MSDAARAKAQPTPATPEITGEQAQRDEAMARLQQAPGVDGAYRKPGGEPPE